ncbi:unnamed protein product [Staurois parvus]|uniref:Uncharacterized protein n=1 Tax=Staurois parvus TaxID=386267 RepID=A0ABN9DYZ8_9NEOB|nr:unnamed protein product [Staurois parvus]
MSLLSGGEQTSPAPVPSAALTKPETGSWKPELGFTMRLGAQVQPLHPSSVLAARHTGISPCIWRAGCERLFQALV